MLDFLDEPKDMATDLVFPTGVSNAYVANSGEGKIVKRLDRSEVNFETIDPTQFTTFDYISDFAIEPLEFVKYNSGSILELIIQVSAEDGNGPIYNISSRIP